MHSPAANADTAPRSLDGIGDWVFRNIVAIAGWFVLITLFLAAFSMYWGGREAFGEFGWGFLTSTDWDPVQENTAPPSRSTAPSSPP